MSFKQLKAEAYKIATQTYGSGYNYSADDRAKAMIAYALLTIVEKLCNTDKE